MNRDESFVDRFIGRLREEYEGHDFGKMIERIEKKLDTSDFSTTQMV